MPPPSASEPTRSYDSPVRRRRAEETRRRIIDSGAAIVHDLPRWDWRDVTYQAVADRAGVSRRTVFRYFATERDLRDAIMARLQDEAGVSLDDLSLDDFAATTARIFSYLSSFPPPAHTPNDPTFAELDQQRRDALVEAVERAAPDWSDDQRIAVAAALDLWWGVPTYERLVTGWGLDADAIAATASWVIDLIEDAVHEGRRPDTPS
jgi:AcrR family transcriptional regulator